MRQFQIKSDNSRWNGVEVGTDGSRLDSSFEENEFDIGSAATRGKGHGDTLAIGSEEALTSQVANRKESIMEQDANPVGFLRGGGGGADRNMGGIGLLENSAGELSAMLTHNILKIGESLNLLQQRRVGAWKLEELNTDCVTAAAKNDSIKGGFATSSRHASGAGRDGIGVWVGNEGVLRCHVTEVRAAG